MNSEQIARIAGVSRSTVSKVLHNYPDIPEDTKRKVLRVASAYGYKPDVVPQLIKSSFSKTIGMYYFSKFEESIFERFNANYNIALLVSVSTEAKQRGYSVLFDVIDLTRGPEALLASIDEDFNNKRISTAVFVGLDDDCGFITKLARPDRHIIVLDKEFDTSTGLRCLFSNDLSSAMRACKHLHDQGFTKIMHIAGDQRKLAGRKRKEGYLRALGQFNKEHGTKVQPLILEGRFTIEHGYNSGKAFIEQRLYEQYDGILFGSDMIGLGFIKCLNDLQPELLDRIGAIGFDNEPEDVFVRPSLTTLAPDYRYFARMIFDLEQNYEEFKAGVSVKIEQQLIVRDSSVPCDKRRSNLPLQEYIGVRT